MVTTSKGLEIDITTDDMLQMVNDLSKTDIVKRLYELTNGPGQRTFSGIEAGSGFREWLEDCQDYPHNSDLVNKMKVIMAWANGKIVAWCVVREVGHPFSKDFGIYCDPEYRRQGIASVLLKEATKYLKVEQCLSCYPWNKVGQSFFKSYMYQERLAIHRR